MCRSAGARAHSRGENLEIRVVEVRDRESLIRATEQGERPGFLFFWAHRPLPGGEIGKPCLSQWWPAPFTVEGTRYLTAEHFMMAEKARLFRDEPARARILEAPDPRAAKQLGRTVKGFDGSRWNEASFGIVVRGNHAKFEQNPPLREFLLNTGVQVLVEASPVDPVWGIGLAAEDPDAWRPATWRGLNLLGFALMEVRRQLRGYGTAF